MECFHIDERGYTGFDLKSNSGKHRSQASASA